MKTILLFLSLLTSAMGFAQHKITLQIDNIPAIKGELRIAVYNRAETFGKKAGILQGVVLTVDSRSMKHTFEGIPTGDYAVAIFHDKNLNNKFDKNWLGIPKEYYGHSNNPNLKLRAPTFKECRFPLNADKNLKIRLRS